MAVSVLQNKAQTLLTSIVGKSNTLVSIKQVIIFSLMKIWKERRFGFRTKRKMKKDWNHYDNYQKQPPSGVLRKSCSENMQQLQENTHVEVLLFNFIEITLRHGRSNFIEITLWRGCSPVNLLHFPRNTSERLFLTLLRAWLKKSCEI